MLNPSQVFYQFGFTNRRVCVLQRSRKVVVLNSELSCGRSSKFSTQGSNRMLVG